MRGLDRIYTKEFFEKWGSGNRDYVAAARHIAGVLFGEFAPRRLIDLGCGCGVYSDAFRRLGADVVAVDAVTPPPEFSFPGPIEIRDLTEPFENVWGDFDMALCLEVAEHIPEESVEAFLANICRFSSLLLFSAAPPFQGGEHHVNERPKRYWRGKLGAHGLLYNRRSTGVLSERFKAEMPPLMWMCQQISVYERKEREGGP